MKLQYVYEFEKRVNKILSYNGGLLIAFEKSIEFFDLNALTPGFKEEYRIEYESTTVVDLLLNSMKNNLIVAVTDKEKTDIILYKIEDFTVQMKSLTLNIEL